MGNEKLPVRRLLAEGVVIIISVLLALAADAWWDSRQESATAQKHLVSLSRDFTQMRVRMDSVLQRNLANDSAGTLLVERLGAGDEPLPADSLYLALIELVDYAVFSPSTGSYSSLVSTGGIELIDDDELKTAIADFFGYFDDVEVTEIGIQRVVFDLTLSPAFASAIGFQNLGRFYTGSETPTRAFDPATESERDQILNYIGVLWAMYGEAARDYAWMSDQIDAIRERLP